jgi:Ser/Thr protein kinase RdoA (MazF antagonist)
MTGEAGMTGSVCDVAFDQLPEAAVLCAPAAPVPADWAQAMLRRHWGLDGTLAALSGERDSNFLLTLGRSAAGAAAGLPQRLLFKVSHPAEPAMVTDFQTQALLHLARQAPDLPVQRLWPTGQGAMALSAPAPDGQPRVLRLLSYLEGLPMPQAPRSAAQRASVARVLARLDHALASLQHPAAALALPWDIQRTHQVRSLVDAMADPARRALAQGALQLFETAALPGLAALPRQPTHNDFNMYNLLVDPDRPEQVSGILDFGDMLAAPRIDDLAVAAAYQVDADGDALGTVAAFAAAYHAESALQAAELDLLWPLVQARLLMVVAISGWRAARQPHHADYLLRNNATSWARLQACAAIPLPQARAALRAACGC